MSSRKLDSTASAEWRSLTAAVEEAGAEVMKAQRSIDAAIDVHRAVRSLNTWTAILDSRLARRKFIEYRDRGSRSPEPFTVVAAAQHTCTDPGCLLRVAASTVAWSGSCPHGRVPIGPACATKD